MKTRTTAAAICGILALQGCAQTPYGPTVQVLPKPGKPFEQFQADDIACRQFASSQVAGQAQAENQRAVGAGVLGTVLGAGLGAAVGGGRGAAIGAGSGAVLGTGIGASGSGNAQYGIQGQYNNAYAQCMYSKGNDVPSYRPVVVNPPPVYVTPPPVVYAPPPPPGYYVPAY